LRSFPDEKADRGTRRPFRRVRRLSTCAESALEVRGRQRRPRALPEERATLKIAAPVLARSWRARSSRWRLTLDEARARMRFSTVCSRRRRLKP